MSEAPGSRPKLVVRNALVKDLPAIRRLTDKVYRHIAPYTAAQLRGQIHNFARGQFVAEYEGQIVGYCATFRASEDLVFADHDWRTISGNGYASRHDPEGDWLYGMEVCVDPDMRGVRIGQRLYQARKNLCIELGLNGIVFGGRMPGLKRRWRSVGSPEAYVEQVKDGKITDRVMSFQMRNGFDVIGVLHDYLPSDKDSKGFASHMVWRNPYIVVDPRPGKRKQRGRLQDTVRIGVVQYQQRKVNSFEEFAHQVEYFVDVIADYRGDFIVFPELFTLQLLSIENEQIPASEAIPALTRYTKDLRDLLSRLAVEYNINIIGGSHPTEDEDGDTLNVCYVCLRDGQVYTQAKIHPTPNERYWWRIEGDDIVEAIPTDCGPIGVLICYDSEFPELSRHLVDQGAQILFVPFCTDERQSYMRVRYSCQARCIENQVYIAMAGNVGNLPGVDNMDIQYSQSCILTPCDFPFARDGIAADTTPNVEMVAVADLSLGDLQEARASGTVQNLRDRRFDLYSVQWLGGKPKPKAKAKRKAE